MPDTCCAFRIGLILILLAVGLAHRQPSECPRSSVIEAILQADKADAIWGVVRAGPRRPPRFRPAMARAFHFTPLPAADGRWAGSLPVLPTKTTGTLEVRTSKGESRKIEDILVGEVWLCGGQSNMSYLVNTPSKKANEATTPELLARAKAEATAAAGSLRYFQTHHRNSDMPLDDVEGNWIIATPETVGGCFALSWNFAVALQDRSMSLSACSIQPSAGRSSRHGRPGPNSIPALPVPTWRNATRTQRPLRPDHQDQVRIGPCRVAKAEPDAGTAGAASGCQAHPESRSIEHPGPAVQRNDPRL